MKYAIERGESASFVTAASRNSHRQGAGHERVGASWCSAPAPDSAIQAVGGML